MKNIFYLLVIFAIACQPKPKDAINMVSVSILPQKYFVDQIAGDLVRVNVLVPPGSSPHNYEVLPSQMKNLSRSKAWLQIGLLAFEENWKDKFAEINKDLLLVNCSKGIDLISGGEHEGEGHDHEHFGGFDPHIWIAPEGARVIAKNTFEALRLEFPEFSTSFEANYSQLIAKIDSVTFQINQELKPISNRKILIFHPTLGYFARQFNLEQIPLELDGKEPSPKHMKDIVDLAREKNIHVIFIQKEFDTENALQLSREIGGELMIIDPLDYDWEKQILNITHKIASQK